MIYTFIISILVIFAAGSPAKNGFRPNTGCKLADPSFINRDHKDADNSATFVGDQHCDNPINRQKRSKFTKFIDSDLHKGDGFIKTTLTDLASNAMMRDGTAKALMKYGAEGQRNDAYKKDKITDVAANSMIKEGTAKQLMAGKTGDQSNDGFSQNFQTKLSDRAINGMVRDKTAKLWTQNGNSYLSDLAMNGMMREGTARRLLKLQNQSLRNHQIRGEVVYHATSKEASANSKDNNANNFNFKT